MSKVSLISSAAPRANRARLSKRGAHHRRFVDKQRMRVRRRGTDGLSTHRWREMDSNFQYASIARWHRATDLPAARSQRPVPISPSTSLSITWCDASFYSISPADSTRTGFSARPRRRPGSTRTTTSTKKVMSARSRRSSPSGVAGIRMGFDSNYRRRRSMT